MKYIADIMTLVRLLLAPVVLWAGLSGSWTVALFAFIVGILTDAFDGTAARRWPYSESENRTKWWRKDPHAFDNVADLSLSTSGLVIVTFGLLSWVLAVCVIAAVGLLSLIFVTAVNMAGRKDKKLAERIDVVHGCAYGLELVAMVVAMTIQATDSWRFVCLFYVLVAIPLLWSKRDRIMSRPEVNYG